MIRSGLVSVTFRQLVPEQVIALVAQADLCAIEWNGNVHVPHGDTAQARSVSRMTMAEGLSVSTYGSYYRAGHPESALGKSEKPVTFEAVVETAVELGAPKIRVWAGTQGTDTANSEYHQLVLEDTQRIADIAQSAGIKIVYEYHGNTLTDTDIAAKTLLETVDHQAVGSFWQPRRTGTIENDLAGIDAVQRWLSDIHVFSWHPTTGERLPLEDRSNDWQMYLRQLNQIPGDRFALLEFVQDDEPDNFLRDAEVLKSWLEE